MYRSDATSRKKIAVVLGNDGHSFFAPPTYLDPTPSWKPPSK